MPTSFLGASFMRAGKSWNRTGVQTGHIAFSPVRVLGLPFWAPTVDHAQGHSNPPWFSMCRKYGIMESWIMAASFWCPYLSSPFPYQPYLSSERQDSLHGKRVWVPRPLILHQLQLAIDSGVSTWMSFSTCYHWSKLSSSPPCWSTITASFKGVLNLSPQKKITAAQSQVTSHIKPTLFLDPRIALILKWTWSASKSSSLPTWCICICFSQSIHDCPGWPASQRCQRYFLRQLQL